MNAKDSLIQLSLSEDLVTISGISNTPEFLFKRLYESEIYKEIKKALEDETFSDKVKSIASHLALEKYSEITIRKYKLMFLLVTALLSEYPDDKTTLNTLDRIASLRLNYNPWISKLALKILQAASNKRVFVSFFGPPPNDPSALSSGSTEIIVTRG